MKKIIILLLSLNFSLFAAGQNSLESLNIPFNAQTFSFAGAGTASINDINASLLNSSQLINIKNLELNVNGNQSFVDTRNVSISLAYPMPFSVFAFSLVYFNYGQVEFRSSDTEQPDSFFSPSDIIFVASFADKLFNLFTLGIDLKYINEKLTLNNQASSIAFNMNTHLNDIVIPYLNVAFTANNIGLGPKYSTTFNSLPLSLQLGLAYTFKLKTPIIGIYDIQLNIDPQYILHDTFYFHSGLSISWYHLPGNINLSYRLGFSYPESTDILSSFRTGLGINYQRYSIDYGAGYNKNLGAEHKLSFSFKLQPPVEHRYIRSITPKKIEKTLDEFNEKEKEFDTESSNPQEDKKNPPQSKETNSEMDFDFEEQ